MADRNLNLNSLGRYGKNSERLILEEHSHCEVPAGCGGVILRWRNPSTGLLFLIHAFCQGSCEIFLDGLAAISTRPLIPYGTHVLSLVVSRIEHQPIIFGLSVVHNENDCSQPRVSQSSQRTVSILTLDDKSWRCTAAQPMSDDWMQAGFDDSQWASMKSCEPPSLGETGRSKYQLDSVQKAGAQLLGFAGESPQLWIRKEFTVSA